MEPKFKLVTGADPELFERRLGDFIASMDRDAIIVDVKFSTAMYGSGVEYSVLVHYQTTDAWED